MDKQYKYEYTEGEFNFVDECSRKYYKINNGNFIFFRSFEIHPEGWITQTVNWYDRVIFKVNGNFIFIIMKEILNFNAESFF